VSGQSWRSGPVLLTSSLGDVSKWVGGDPGCHGTSGVQEGHGAFIPSAR